MDQQPAPIANRTTQRPTEVRLKLPAAPLQGWPEAFDPTQIARSAAYCGMPNADVDPFVSQDTVALGRYLAEHDQT
jgi:hypothetical protein